MTLFEMLEKINSKKNEVKALAEAGKLAEAKAAKAELENLQEQYDILKDVSDNPAGAVANQGAHQIPAGGSDDTFANHVRNLPMNSLNETTGANGGYIVPQDIQTRINQYKQSHRSIRDLVDVEPVTTNKGSRVYQKKSKNAGFEKVDENGNLKAMAEPAFDQVQYTIEDYGGYLPVSNDLLNDTDANLEDTIVVWSAEGGMQTDNREIFKIAKDEGTNVELQAGINGIRSGVIKRGSAYDSIIVTNDDGLAYLDTLEDKQGRPLLNPDPTQPTKMQLRCGVKIVPVEVFSNAELPSDTTTSPGSTIIPFICGDLRAAFKIFDRQQTVLYASKSAVVTSDGSTISFNAFQQRGTLYRADMRADYKMIDKDAFFYGKMTIPDAEAASVMTMAASEAPAEEAAAEKAATTKKASK